MSRYSRRGSRDYGYGGWAPYVPVAERRRQAAEAAAKMNKSGKKMAPVAIAGRNIAHTFWGKGWCDHMESFHDFANRLPRGRTYVRNGSVIDLQIEEGVIRALVQGSSLYTIKIKIKPLAKTTWQSIKSACSGHIASLVELLQGKLSHAVLQVIAHRQNGLFPQPGEIDLDCSCPDWADMCKHVAAVLYGVGARLDQQPELLFVLRQVDHLELISHAATTGTLEITAQAATAKVADADLADVFGIEIDTVAVTSRAAAVASANPSASVSRRPRGRPRKSTSASAPKVSSRTAEVRPEAVDETPSKGRKRQRKTAPVITPPPALTLAPRKRGRPRKDEVSAKSARKR